MQPFERFIRETFDEYKCKHPSQPLITLPVYDQSGAICAKLRPITADFRRSLPGCEALLARWRNENPTMSPRPFTATAQGTEHWLEQQVIDQPGRILFLLLDAEGRAVGHLGFASFDYQTHSCEVDAVLRGEADARPGMMAFAMNSLIGWGLNHLGLRGISLRVLSDNTHAIRFYERLCFVAGETIPVDNSPDTEAAGAPTYTRMRLDIPRWREQTARQAPVCCRSDQP